MKSKLILFLSVLFISFSLSAQRQIAEKYKIEGTEKAKSGNYSEALEALSKAIQIDPTYAAAYNNRGIVKMSMENYEEAVIDFTKAIEQDATDHAFYVNRAMTKSKMDKFEDAIADYSMAIGLSPDDATLYQKRGLMKYEQKDYKGGVEDLNKAIELVPGNADFVYYRGLVKMSSPEMTDGYKDFFKAADMGHMKAKMMITDVFFDNMEENKEFALSTKCSMKFYLKDFEGVIPDLNALIKIRPKNSQAYFHRGISKIHTTDTIGGCTDLKKAVKYGKTSAEAQIKAYCH